MSATANVALLENWQKDFIAWCKAQARIARRGGARLLANQLDTWSAAGRAGDANESHCAAYFDSISGRKLYHLDRGILAKLVGRARAAVRGTSDLSARVLGRGPNCPAGGSDLTAHRTALATNRQYTRDFNRYLYAGQLPTSGTASYQTIRTRTAAVRVLMCRRIRAATATIRQRGRVDQEVFDFAADALVDGLARLKKLDQALANGPTQAVGSPTTPTVPQANGGSGRKRRRQGLGPYGDDAENRVFDTAPGFLVDACAVVIAAGARPKEVARGIKVRRYGDLLLVRVPGAKVTDDNGQPLRCIWLLPVNKAAKHLHRLAVMAGGTVRINAPSSKAVCDAMARAGRNAYPNRRHTPTAYSFRHEAITGWRACGDARTTAQAAGHASARTQQGYGTRRRKPRGGRNPMVRVSATRPIRALDRVRARPQLRSPGTGTRKP